MLPEVLRPLSVYESSLIRVLIWSSLSMALVHEPPHLCRRTFGITVVLRDRQ